MAKKKGGNPAGHLATLKPFKPTGLPIPGEKLVKRPRSVYLQESVDAVIESLPPTERSKLLREIITQGFIDRGLLKI
jgi:hypothetical protein